MVSFTEIEHHPEFGMATYRQGQVGSLQLIISGPKQQASALLHRTTELIRSSPCKC